VKHAGKPGTYEKPVHPNSMAARKWGRKSWHVNLWAEAAIAKRDGDGRRASALRRRAAKLDGTRALRHC
jgi:hypothetical protein